jgi:cysteine desulfurase family protein (TIGR01976 family)
MTSAAPRSPADRPPTHGAVASVETIRREFPALARAHRGAPVAYFDGPGGSQTPRAVAEAMVDYLYYHNANTHWAYPSSAETDAMLESARGALGDFLHCGPHEVVFGANSTTLAFHAARAIGQTCSPGDEIVVTELDHHANVGPWQAAARERGLTLQVVRMDAERGTLDWQDFERRVGPRTRVVAVGAASNALGTITDVARAAQIAHDVGALAFVDAVHYAPHELVDVAQLDCDFLMCSAYKFYGPHVGVLFGRQALLEELPLAKVQPASNAAPERAETGTLNHEGIAGAAAAVDFLASLAGGASRRERLATTFAELHRRGVELVGRMWTGLAAIERVRLFGPPPDRPRTSTVAFTVDGVASSEVARRLAEQAVFASHGDFYAATVVERLGLGPEGLVRAGCACYTTAEEVDRLVEGVRSLTA